jgi:hypothetical protein
VVLAVTAAVLFALRLFQQLLMDRSVVARCSAGDTERADRRLALSQVMLRVEVLVGLAVLLISSLILVTVPPESRQNPYSKMIMSGQVHITLADDPLDVNAFHVSFEDMASGSVVDMQEVVITAGKQENGNTGPVTLESEKRFEGEYTFPKEALPDDGVWKIEVTGRRPAEKDAVAAFTVDYPNDTVSSANTGARRFGPFEILAAAVAAGAVLGAALLFRFSRELGKQCRRR